MLNLYELKKPLLVDCLFESALPFFIDPTLTLYEFLEVVQLGQGYIWARSERLVYDPVFWNIDTDKNYQEQLLQYLKDSNCSTFDPYIHSNERDWLLELATAIELWIESIIEDLIDFGYIEKLGVNYA